MIAASSSRLLHERDAARTLDVSASTLRRWRSLGMGPAYVRVGGKRGSTVRYRESVLIGWLENNTVDPTMGATDVRA